MPIYIPLYSIKFALDSSLAIRIVMLPPDVADRACELQDSKVLLKQLVQLSIELKKLQKKERNTRTRIRVINTWMRNYLGDEYFRSRNRHLCTTRLNRKTRYLVKLGDVRDERNHLKRVLIKELKQKLMVKAMIQVDDMEEFRLVNEELFKNGWKGTVYTYGGHDGYDADITVAARKLKIPLQFYF